MLHSHDGYSAVSLGGSCARRIPIVKRSLAAGGVNLDTTPLLQSVNEFVLMPQAAELVVVGAQIHKGDCNGHLGSSQAA